MNGQSYYQYQVAAPGTSALMLPQAYLAAPGSVMAGQTVLMSPSGYAVVPPPPPPVAAPAVNPTPDYAGSTISAPASLYSQVTSSNSETTDSQTTQTTASTTESSVVTTTITTPKASEIVTESTTPTTTVDGATAYSQINTAASSSTISMTQQANIQAIQQQQAIELQQALAARTPLTGYGVQKAVQPQMQLYNPYAAQPTIAIDAYGRQYVLQYAPAQQKVASYPMVAGQNLVQPSYVPAAGAPTKLHTTTTLELPSQQPALQNLYLPNAAVAQQQALGLQGYYNPATAAAVAPQAALSGGVPRQQLVQYNGQTYLTYMPQSQVVQRKY